MMNKNEIVIFENDGIKLEVNMKDENVWLSQHQMAELFDSSRTNIIEHINNIYHDGELDKSSTCQDFRQVRKEGKRNVARSMPFYNLDMIISVGYRVNSKRGVIFRKWATKVLKEYLLKGYAVNQRRLDYLEKTVKLIDIANRMDDRLEGDDAKEILRVIGSYSKALELLDDYDHKTIKKINGSKSKKRINYKNCLEVISKLRFNDDSDVFALERNRGLESIINDIYQTFDNEDVYKSTEEKASNFLYMIVKNHVFIDGNKRIAATLFIYFLNYYGLLYKEDKLVIDNNTLAALTLLIAESNPKEKDIIISLVMNFLE